MVNTLYTSKILEGSYVSFMKRTTTCTQMSKENEHIHRANFCCSRYWSRNNFLRVAWTNTFIEADQTIAFDISGTRTPIHTNTFIGDCAITFLIINDCVNTNNSLIYRKWHFHLCMHKSVFSNSLYVYFKLCVVVYTAQRALKRKFIINSSLFFLKQNFLFFIRRVNTF